MRLTWAEHGEAMLAPLFYTSPCSETLSQAPPIDTSARYPNSFVIKTADLSNGTKVFINVCASDKVPAPGNWKTGQVPEEVRG